jgi:hypothetical protein
MNFRDTIGHAIEAAASGAVGTAKSLMAYVKQLVTSVNDIHDTDLPAISNKIDAGFALTGDAVVGNVLDGKFFYKDNYQAKLEGTMPNNSSNNVEVTDVDGTLIPTGFYDGTGSAVLSAAEAAKVVSGNILSGVTLLGVAGKTEVVDTTEAGSPAAEGDIASGKVAFVNGVKITGTHV